MLSTSGKVISRTIHPSSLSSWIDSHILTQNFSTVYFVDLDLSNSCFFCSGTCRIQSSELPPCFLARQAPFWHVQMKLMFVDICSNKRSKIFILGSAYGILPPVNKFCELDEPIPILVQQLDCFTLLRVTEVVPLLPATQSKRPTHFCLIIWTDRMTAVANFCGYVHACLASCTQTLSIRDTAMTIMAQQKKWL